ncbi:hypothetical protein [Streptomyces nigra]|uniref:hypothetical protein n=1 Tax=Streptomyces nigra TaxID=1827580 RepID=UPI0036253789
MIRREHDGPRPRPEFVHLGVDFDDELDTDSLGVEAELCHDSTDGYILRLVRVPRYSSPLGVRQDHNMAEALLPRSDIKTEEGPLIVVVGNTDSSHHAIGCLLGGTARGIDEHGTRRRIGQLPEQLGLSCA